MSLPLRVFASIAEWMTSAYELAPSPSKDFGVLIDLCRLCRLRR